MKKKITKIMKPVNVMATATVLSSTFTFSTLPTSAEVKSQVKSHYQQNAIESEFKVPTELVQQGYTRFYPSNDTDFYLNEAVIFENGIWKVEDKGPLLRENLSDSLHVLDKEEYLKLRHDVNDKSIFGIYLTDGMENNDVSAAGVGQVIKVIPGVEYDVKVSTRGIKVPGYPNDDFNLTAIIQDEQSDQVYSKSENFKNEGSFYLDNTQTVKMIGDSLQIGVSVKFNELKKDGREVFGRLQADKSSVQMKGPSILKAQYVTKRVEGEAIPKSTVRLKLSSGKVFETTADENGVYIFSDQNLEENTTIEVQQEVKGITSKSTTETVESAFTYLSGIVDKLFTNTEYNELMTDVNQTRITNAKDLVELHLSGEEEQQLNERLAIAQSLLNAQESVSSLQDNNGNLLPNKNREDINESNRLVSMIPNGPTKEVLTTTLERLEKELEEREELERLEQATKLVEKLYTNKQFNELNKEVKQSDINNADEAIQVLREGDAKEELQNLLNVAQQMLAVTILVDSLSNESGEILPDTTQTDIDHAREKVEEIKEGPTKSALIEKLDNLQNQLDELSLIAIESLNPVEDSHSTVSGKVKEKVDKVHIYLNNTLIRVRPVDKETGDFIGHVSNNLKLDDKITVIPQDDKGRMGIAVDTFVKESTRVAAPDISAYQEGKERLIGKSSEGTAYVRVYLNETHIRKRNVEENGDLMVYVKDSNPKPGDILKVVPYNKDHISGKEVTLTVQERPLLLDRYVEGDELIFGNTSFNASRVEIYLNDEYIGLSKIDPETGEFRAKVRLNNTLPKAGDRLKAISYNELGEKTLTNSIIVGKQEMIETPKPKEYKENDELIVGTVGENTDKLRLYHGKDFKEVLNRGFITKEKKFKFYVQDLNLKKGDKVRLVSLDKFGRESAASNVTVK